MFLQSLYKPVLTLLVAAFSLSFSLYSHSSESDAPSDTVAGDRPTSSYLISPGDILDVSVWDEPTLQREVLVLPDTSISFPLVGSLSVDGFSIAQVASQLTARLETYIPNASVHVALKSTPGARVYVIGKVNRPGEIPLDKPLQVLQALSVAGGLSTFADKDEVRVLRNVAGNQVAIDVPMSALMSGERLDKNIVLRSGDVVVVN